MIDNREVEALIAELKDNEASLFFFSNGKPNWKAIVATVLAELIDKGHIR